MPVRARHSRRSHARALVFLVASITTGSRVKVKSPHVAWFHGPHNDIALPSERKPARAWGPHGRSWPRRRRVRAEPRRSRASRSRARPKAGRSLPHMDDAPAVAAEVVVEVREVGADRGEGLAGGAGGHGASQRALNALSVVSALSGFCGI